MFDKMDFVPSWDITASPNFLHIFAIALLLANFVKTWGWISGTAKAASTKVKNTQVPYLKRDSKTGWRGLVSKASQNVGS